MSEDKIIMHAPVEVELLIHITDGEGQEGKITYSMPAGRYPTAEEMAEGVKTGLDAAKKQLGEKFRLASRPEFFNKMLAEKTGIYQEFACAKEWDAL